MIIKRGGDQIHIRKAWGGFCWPGDTSGHCCVVGEAQAPVIDYAKGYIFHLYYMEEFSCDKEGARELIEAAVDMTERFNVERWYGRGFHDKDNDDFLKAWNRGIRSRSSKRFNVKPALNTDTEKIKYHLQILDSCLQPGEVILEWLKGTDIERELSSLGNVNWNDATCRQFPALASCGYVVSMLRALTQKNVPMFG